MDQPAAPDDDIIAYARHLLSSDIMRRDLLRERPVSFIQWYVVLELFIAGAEERDTVVTDLTHDAGVPRSTALKAIADLVDLGVVLRTTDARDRRRAYLTLDKIFRDRVQTILIRLMTHGRL